MTATQTPAAEQAAKTPPEVREYQRQILAEARRLQAEHGWCDSGVNTYLAKVGLSGTGARVPVVATIEATRWVDVPGAVDAEDAEAMVAENDGIARDAVHREVANYYGAGLPVTAIRPLTDDERDPVEAQARGWDFTRAGRTYTDAGQRICGNYSAGGFTCTRVRDHRGNHAAGSGTTIERVWS